MKSLISTIIVIVFSVTLYAQEKKQVYYTNVKFLYTVTSTKEIKYRYSVYMLPNQTYAYVIFADDQKYLHQANMPGKPDTVGFRSKEDAEKVAELVIKRLMLPVVPPKVNTVEMQYLGVN